MLVLHFLQIYIGEVSPPSIRGKLGALFQMSICFGALFSYLFGTYLFYWQLAFLCTGVSVVELVLTCTIRESPRLSRNPLKNIKRGWRWMSAMCYRDQTLSGNNASERNSKSSFKSNALRIVLVSFTMFFRQFCGVCTLMCFAGPIFHAAGLDRGSVTSGLLAFLTIGVVQIIASFLSLFVVDRFGRRIPVFFGGLALMVANIGMGVYFGDTFGFLSSAAGSSTMEFTNSSSIQNCVSVPLKPSPLADQLSPLPIASVCLFFVAYSLSWGPIPWIIGGELFPGKIRELGMGISAAFNLACMIAVLSIFPVISTAVGQAIPFLVLAVCSLMSSIFVVLFLAETKGLELNQISSMEVTNVKKNVKEFGLLLGWLLRCGFVRKIDLPHKN